MERVICARCPSCGSAKFTTIAPIKGVAFRKDRQCLRCETCYSPPTPRWGAVTMIAIGALIVLGCSLSILLGLVARSLIGLPANFGFGFLGAICLRQGIISLRETVAAAPDVVEPEAENDRHASHSWIVVGVGLGFVAIVSGLVVLEIRYQQRRDEEKAALQAKHRAAIRALKQIGGQVNGWDGDQGTAISLQRADAQTRMFEGQHVGNRDFVDDDLKVIALFPRLERLWIASPEITNAGLAQVPAQPMLESLSIECEQVSDDGLTFVGSMRQLKSLDLSGTAVRELTTLQLDQKPYLRDLKLSGTPVSDEVAAALVLAKSLTTLDLSQTSISDGILLKLTELPLLEELRLDYTNVTDEGIQNLRQLSQLKFLSVDETQVTEEGVAELKKHLPQCQIVLRWVRGPGGILFAPRS